MVGFSRRRIPSTRTIDPWQLHEYLSDKDVCESLSYLLNMFYQLRISNLDSEVLFLLGGRFCDFAPTGAQSVSG